MASRSKTHLYSPMLMASWTSHSIFTFFSHSFIHFIMGAKGVHVHVCEGMCVPQITCGGQATT